MLACEVVALEFKCPKCKAKVGELCVSLTASNKKNKHPHSERRVDGELKLIRQAASTVLTGKPGVAFRESLATHLLHELEILRQVKESPDEDYERASGYQSTWYPRGKKRVER